MEATDLIGKKAIRIAPTNEVRDRSYTNRPLKIINATKYHIYYEYADQWDRTYMDTDIHILGSEFCDDKWVEYKTP